jgi:P27 family predicted phage terminase small subunit
MVLYSIDSQRGRKPIPTAIKKLEADDGPRAKYHNHRPIEDEFEPIPDELGTLPRPPAGLLKGRAMREYNRIGKQLMKMKVLSDLDHAALEVYCSSYAAWVNYTMKAQKMPLIKDGATIKLNPFCTLADREYSKFRAAAAELGLTPALRSRIKIDKPDSQTEGNLLS